MYSHISYLTRYHISASHDNVFIAKQSTYNIEPYLTNNIWR